DSLEFRGVPPPFRMTVAGLAAATIVLAGCGGGSGGNSSSSGFPSAQGKVNLRDLVKGLPQGPNLAPSVSRLPAGMARFGFGLFDRDNNPVNGAQVAVYTASASQTD